MGSVEKGSAQMNPAVKEMSVKDKNWFEVCLVSDIPVRGAVRVKHAQRNIAIFRTADDAIRALEDRCPHKGGPLSSGIVHGNCVTCPLHNWDISLDTGEAVGADEGQVQKYKVDVNDGRVFIEAPVPVASLTA